MYKEYLAEFWYSDTGAHYLAYSGEYVAPPSIDFVRQLFLTIGYGEEVLAKGTLKKSLLSPRLCKHILGGHHPQAEEETNRKGCSLHSIYLPADNAQDERRWDDEVTLYPTQVFSVNNWALKPNQPKEPPFTDHMLAICAADKLVVFKAPKLSSIAKRVPQGTKPRAQPRHKKQSTLKQPSVSSKVATKGGSSKAPTGSKTGHSKKRKESSSAMDSNPS
ncbi:hypothetical protein Tco_1423380 [Tanacetum coccineum]